MSSACMLSRPSGSSSLPCSASGSSGASCAPADCRQTYRNDISYRYMETTAVTWAVLGVLVQRPRSGYELKQAVDRAIRHFWAASYGQIYPELKRLEGAGWIAGEHAPRGGRARRIYRITPAGR